MLWFDFNIPDHHDSTDDETLKSNLFGNNLGKSNLAKDFDEIKLDLKLPNSEFKFTQKGTFKQKKYQSSSV